MIFVFSVWFCTRSVVVTESSTSKSDTASISNPLNRKCCYVCSKFLYFHQPILFCQSCHRVCHGNCVKLDNNRIFWLQQISWYCPGCAVNNSSCTFTCQCCSQNTDIYNDQYEICKNCFKITHKTCTFQKSCLNCIPTFTSTNDISITIRYSCITIVKFRRL